MSEQTNATNTAAEQDENHIIAERRAKLAEWKATGKAYPNDFSRENTAGKITELYSDKTGEELEAAQPLQIVASADELLNFFV